MVFWVHLPAIPGTTQIPVSWLLINSICATLSSLPPCTLLFKLFYVTMKLRLCSRPLPSFVLYMCSLVFSLMHLCAVVDPVQSDYNLDPFLDLDLPPTLLYDTIFCLLHFDMVQCDNVWHIFYWIKVLQVKWSKTIWNFTLQNQQLSVCKHKCRFGREYYDKLNVCSVTSQNFIITNAFHLQICYRLLVVEITSQLTGLVIALRRHGKPGIP